MATVLLGLAEFVHHPDYLKSAADLHRLTAPGGALPHTLAEVASGVVAGRASGYHAWPAGAIATPILRVAVSLVGFALQRDRTYTAVRAAVLLVL